MNSHRRRDEGARGAGALLASMVEEAIVETLAPAEAGPRPEPGPVGADAFLADAAAFLRARPDAAELLGRLQAMLAPAPPAAAPPTPAPPAPGEG